jgi:hypothetical protein
MGPGSPNPVAYAPRAIGKGKQLSYSSKQHQVQADVAKGRQGTNLNASFQPRPPVRPPGVKGLGDASIDVSA